MAETIGYRPKGAIIGLALSTSVLVVKALFETRMGWFLPLVIILLLMALILGVLALVSPIAPFVYPLF